MSLGKGLAKNLGSNLVNNPEKNLEKDLAKNLGSSNCTEFGKKRANTTKLTCSIAIFSIISLALPLPLGASPEPLVASPELLVASPELLVASPELLAASPELLVASPELLVASPELLAASPKHLAASPKSVATKSAVGGSAGGRSAWCHAVVSQPLPAGAVVGSIGGRPFKPEFIQWNSYSITLKQNRKRYCKVVINMMRSQKPLCNLAFTSDSNNRPHIYVYTRSTNSEPIKEQHYTSKDGYGLKLALLSPLVDDWIPGSLSLRLPDGSFVAGSFKAEKAPRIIWDDESVNP